MFGFILNGKAYAEIRGQVCRDAEFECQKLNLAPEQILVEAFNKGNLSMTGEPMMGKKKTNSRTPDQLKGVVDALLAHPPVLSAWLVRYHVTRALISAHLPVHVQGDLMMALENSNYVLPEKAEAEAQLLAYAICMLPTLGRARATLFGLGTPLSTRPISAAEFQTAIRFGYLPEDCRATGEKTVLLGWNCEMRKNVAVALERIDPRLSELMKLWKFRSVKKRPLETWKHELAEEAIALLQKGIELAGGNEAEKDQAFKMLEEAALKDSELLPDALRNQAWILSKRGDREGAVRLERKVLELTPDYAEVWYAMGIDLGAMARYEEALEAYQTAKRLGHRSKGLEHNIKVCMRGRDLCLKSNGRSKR